ncbi:MAG: replication initiation factor domain-containing protein, partial [Erysipelotrichaceae bacterium]|uniref:replication initiation factor domain-containing protein n=1 Tax=Anaerorhabdus sp. TaxID=1872524 RepID=UPI002FCBD9C1
MTKNSKVAPLNNMGGTAYNEKCEIAFCESLIDWFCVCIKKHTLNDVFNYFGKDFYKCDFAPMHYDYMLVYYEKIKILVSNRKDMNICVLLSGRACRELEEHYSWDTFFRFIKMYSHHNKFEYIPNYNITRIDYSFDYYNWKFDIVNRVGKYFDNNLFTSFSRKNIYTVSKNSKGQVIGKSIRFGKRGNEFSLIFYDKLKERNQSDHVVSKNIKSWFRMEATFSQSLAMVLFDVLNDSSNNVQKFVVQYIYKKIDFKKKVKGYTKESKNLCRVATAQWWTRLLGTMTKSTFSKKAYQCTIDQKKNFIEHSVAKTLSLVYVMQNLVNGETNQQSYLKSLWEIGSEKVGDKELGIANDYLEKNGKEKITIDELKQ